MTPFGSDDAAEVPALEEFDEVSDGSLLRREFDEVHDLASRLHGMLASGVALNPGRYSATLSTAELGGVTLQVVRSMPILMLGAPAEGKAGLIQMLEGAGHARWNGSPVGTNEIALCVGGRRHEARYTDEFALALVSFGAGGAAASALAGADARRDGPAQTATPGNRSVLPPLAKIALAVERAAKDVPCVLRNAEALRSLRADVLDAAQGRLMPAAAGREPRTRASPDRQRLVHQADSYLRANPARPVYTDDLCAALGTSATRLSHVFHATFGISPHRYLKLRRMSMVRAALLARAGPWHSVKAAALSHGFWHLGQFAHDYRARYGEAPSDTLRRALPRSGEGA